MNKDKLLHTMNDIIATQDAYIEFLGNEIGKYASFLSTHGIFASEDVIRYGEELREKISKLKREYLNLRGRKK